MRATHAIPNPHRTQCLVWMNLICKYVVVTVVCVCLCVLHSTAEWMAWDECEPWMHCIEENRVVFRRFYRKMGRRCGHNVKKIKIWKTCTRHVTVICNGIRCTDEQTFNSLANRCETMDGRRNLCQRLHSAVNTEHSIAVIQECFFSVGLSDILSKLWTAHRVPDIYSNWRSRMLCVSLALVECCHRHRVQHCIATGKIMIAIKTFIVRNTVAICLQYG